MHHELLRHHQGSQQRNWLIASLLGLLAILGWRLAVGADWLANTLLAFTLLLRPDEVLSGILDAPVLEVAHDALRVLLQHRHMGAGCVA
jgi:hypothetical protein